MRTREFSAGYRKGFRSKVAICDLLPQACWNTIGEPLPRHVKAELAVCMRGTALEQQRRNVHCSAAAFGSCSGLLAVHRGGSETETGFGLGRCAPWNSSHAAVSGRPAPRR